jgi:hypothetical protein
VTARHAVRAALAKPGRGARDAQVKAESGDDGAGLLGTRSQERGLDDVNAALTPRRVLSLQRRVGNSAVVQLLRRRHDARPLGRTPLTVQRHSSKALEDQLEDAERENEIGTLQRHAMSAQKPIRSQRGPLESEVPTREYIGFLMRWIVDALKTEVAPKMADPAKAARRLTPALCEPNFEAVKAGGIPAAASEQTATFMIYVRNPVFYTSEGKLDKGQLIATLVHESLHAISWEHRGLQNIEFEDADKATKKLSDLGEKNSLDEAMTEQLAIRVYEKISQTSYRTSYWQTIRDLGVHCTADGLKELMRHSRPYTEKNWTGGLADIVVRRGIMTMAELDDLYLNGPDGVKDKAPLARLKNEYAEVVKEWEQQKADVWNAALPPGVLAGKTWVEMLRATLQAAKDKALKLDDAIESVRKATGHELVGPDDPRSHVFASKKKAYNDDFEILNEYYSYTVPDQKIKNPALGLGGWKGGKKEDAEGIRQLAIQQGARLGITDKNPYPHIVIPNQDTFAEPTPGQKVRVIGTRCDTPFKDYPVAVFNPDLPSIENKSIADLSGVDATRSAYEVIDELGKGAYETNGEVVLSHTIEARTLLHEIGHWKQDKKSGGQSINEKGVNSKLLEYHNIVLNENEYDENPDTGLRRIRLSYTGTPMVGQQKGWDVVLPDMGGAEPSQYSLLKHIANDLEKTAIAQIEAKMSTAEGSDKKRIYTEKMKWYLRQQMALEYFKSRAEV